MQCNYNSFIQIINFHGLFRNALRCEKTGACRKLMPLRYTVEAPIFSRNWNSAPESITEKPMEVYYLDE